MAAGDITTGVISVDDDGSKLDTWLTGKVVVADDITITHISGNRVVVAIVKAA